MNPEWLMGFLNNPSLSDTDTNRDGVRQYLKARMPTFSFSEGELRKLVRFFAALSSQAEPFIPEKVDPISDQERTMARQLFTSEGAPCLKCHMDGDPAHDARATAPNFTVAKDRLQPDWVKRWILDPALMSPGTAMPSGLFRKDGDRWVFAGTDAGEFQRLHQGPGGPAGPLYVLIHAGRIGPAESQRWQVELSCSTRRKTKVKKIWIAAGVAGALTPGRMRRRRKAEAPKADAAATPAARRGGHAGYGKRRHDYREGDV